MRKIIEDKFHLLQKIATIEKVLAVEDCLNGQRNLEVTVLRPEKLFAEAWKYAKARKPHFAKVDNKKAKIEKQKVDTGCLVEVNHGGNVIAVFITSRSITNEVAHQVGLKLMPKKRTTNAAKNTVANARAYA